MKLADALLRRKELQQKVDQSNEIRLKDLFDIKATRKPVSESIDDVVVQVPKLELNQVTREYDYYASNLRKIDAAIQQLNWTTDINVDENVWINYGDK